MSKGKGIRAYSLEDWEDYAEFNVDFEERERFVHIQLRLTPREHYLLCHYALMQTPKVSLHESIHLNLQFSGLFNCSVTDFGVVDYSNMNNKTKKKSKKRERFQQLTLF